MLPASIIGLTASGASSGGSGDPVRQRASPVGPSPAILGRARSSPGGRRALAASARLDLHARIGRRRGLAPTVARDRLDDLRPHVRQRRREALRSTGGRVRGGAASRPRRSRRQHPPPTQRARRRTPSTDRPRSEHHAPCSRIVPEARRRRRARLRHPDVDVVLVRETVAVDVLALGAAGLVTHTAYGRNSGIPVPQYPQSQIISSTPMRRASACGLPALSGASSRRISLSAPRAPVGAVRARPGASRARAVLGVQRGQSPCPASTGCELPGRADACARRSRLRLMRGSRAPSSASGRRDLDRDVGRIGGRPASAWERARGLRSVSDRRRARPARRSPARRSAIRSIARPRSPQLSRIRSAGTAAAEPSTDWCVMACGTSISDSTPPSDSASVNSLVRAAIRPRRDGGTRPCR